MRKNHIVIFYTRSVDGGRYSYSDIPHDFDDGLHVT